MPRCFHPPPSIHPSIHPSIKKHTYRCSDRPQKIDCIVLRPQGLPKFEVHWSQRLRKPKRSCLPSCQKVLALKFARNIFLLLLKIKFQCGKALVLAMLNCLVEKVCLAPNALCLCCGSVSIFWSCVVYDFVPALWLCTFFFFYVHPGGDVGLLLAYTDFQKHTGCTAVVWKAAVYSGYGTMK